MRLTGLTGAGCALLLAVTAAAQPAAEVAYSQSGQFVVAGRHRAPQAARLLRFDPPSGRFVTAGWTPGQRLDGPVVPATNEPTLLLDPNYLVASAERLRAAFTGLLELREPPRGRIYLQLLEAAGPRDEITFNQVYDRLKHTWNVRISLPAELPPDRLLRVLVQALLFEAAHRGAGPGGAEIPLWLSEGLIAHLSERFGDRVLLEPAQTVNVSYSPLDEARRLRAALGRGACLTLEQLSWPGLLADTPEVRQQFTWSAHALVLELLQLPEGGRALGQLIRALPRFENWQFAFLEGFARPFPTLLDAEKWWAIHSLRVGGRDGSEKWTLHESLKRLDAALVLPVERRRADEPAGAREELELLAAIRTLGFEQQRPLLTRAISGLFALELRAAPHAVRLIADHRAALERYLADREAARRQDRDRVRATRQEPAVIEAALRQLETLAQVRRDFELLLPGEALPEISPARAVSATRP